MENNQIKAKPASNQLWLKLWLALTSSCMIHLCLVNLSAGFAPLALFFDLALCLAGALFQAYVFGERLFLADEALSLSRAGEATGVLLGVDFKDRVKFADTVSRLGGVSFYVRLSIGGVAAFAVFRIGGGDLDFWAILIALGMALSALPVLMFLPLFCSALAVIMTLLAGGHMHEWNGFCSLLVVFASCLYFSFLFVSERQRWGLFAVENTGAKTATFWQAAVVFGIVAVALFAILPKNKPLTATQQKIHTASPMPTHTPRFQRGSSRGGTSPAFGPESYHANGTHPSEGEGFVADQSITGVGQTQTPSGDTTGQAPSPTIDEANPRQIPASAREESSLSGENTDNAAQKSAQRHAANSGRTQGGAEQRGSANVEPGSAGSTVLPHGLAKQASAVKGNNHDVIPFQKMWAELKWNLDKLPWRKMFLMFGVVVACGIFFMKQHQQRPQAATKPQEIALSQKKRLIQVFRANLAALAQESVADARGARRQIILMYNLLLDHLAQCGMPRADSQTPDAFAQEKCISRLRLIGPMQEVTRIFCAVYYGEKLPSAEIYQAFIRQVADIGCKVR